MMFYIQVNIQSHTPYIYSMLIIIHYHCYYLQWVYSLVILPNGRIVSGSYDKSIKIWNTDTGTCEQTLTGHTDVSDDDCDDSIKSIIMMMMTVIAIVAVIML